MNNTTDFKSRVLCSDGTCIGVIGHDGKCKECGKPYNDHQDNFELENDKITNEEWFKCKTCGFVAFGDDPSIAKNRKCLGCGKIMGAEPIVNQIKNPRQTESIRKNAKQRKEAENATGSFIPNLICMLAKIAKADGAVTSEEIEVIRNFFQHDLKLDDKSYNIAISIFNDAKSSPEPIEPHARNLLQNIGSDSSVLINIINLLFSVAIADGHFSVEEELLINKVEVIFGVSGKTEYSKFKNERESSQDEENSELRYYDILGLSIDADPPEIKITYRRLVMQYHPDHVQHLGSEFQALAEEKIKEINMAYKYLQKKYNL